MYTPSHLQQPPTRSHTPLVLSHAPFSLLLYMRNPQHLLWFIFSWPLKGKEPPIGHTLAKAGPAPSSLLLIPPIIPGSVSLPCANFSPSPEFIPFRYLQAVIMYPLSRVEPIKFFSSFLINQSLNPSKPFNRTCCSSLNSFQFPHISDNVVTRGWL